MVPSYQRLGISDLEPHRPKLVHEVYSTIYNESRMIYSVPLTYVATWETNLDAGRFVHYEPWMQEHLVAYDIADYMKDNFEERLGWISQNINHAWSFDLRMRHVGEGRMQWSFEDRTEAILFKLSF